MSESQSLALGFDARARLVPVVGDSMAPTLTDGDVVMVRPVDDFDGDGLYVLIFFAATEIRRCDRSVKGRIRIMLDNTLYHDGPPPSLPPEAFREHVVGRVIAACRRVP